MSQISSIIDQQILVKWFVAFLLQNIREPLRMYEILTYEDALKKYQRVKSNDDCYALTID